jgi:TetR/AcrR family transcriptional regulator, transcriptional repressor for nem operon
MPWPKERKGKTRQRIVQTAASAFRKQGIADVGIAELMKRAGLTHGGFYAHFSSKEDLLAEALALASKQVSATLRETANNQPPSSALLSIADTYLSTKHLQHPEAGCPVAALGPELARSTANVRQTLANGIRGRLQALLDFVPDDLTATERRQVAAGVLACMVGGLILARGLPESEALQLLGDCRSFLGQRLDHRRGPRK